MAKKLTPEEYICPACGHFGRAAIRLRGSAGVERFLWYALLIPGPIYSLWRRSGNSPECSACGATHIVPLDSKLGSVMFENQMRGRNKPPAKTPPAKTPKDIL